MYEVFTLVNLFWLFLQPMWLVKGVPQVMTSQNQYTCIHQGHNNLNNRMVIHVHKDKIVKVDSLA